MRLAGASLGLVLAVAGSAAPMSVRETLVARQGPWRIVYELRRPEAGAGAAKLPVVLVHGANSDHRFWRRQMAELSWSGPLVAIDLLGHGESDKPEDADYSFATLAAGVAAVLDDLGLDRAILVGHSNGVPTVREFYRRFPERTRALVLADGALQAPLTPQMVEWMRASLAGLDWEARRIEMVRQTPRGALDDGDFALVTETALATPRHVMAAGLDAMVDAETWREDPIDVPVLMIVAKGSGQGLWSDQNRKLAERLAGQLEFQVWEGVSHFFPLERPEGFNRRVESFLAGLGE